jgi:antitoxin VapB
VNETAFHPEDKAVNKIRNTGNPEPIEKPTIDLDEFWAKLDALGAGDFLPDGIPDEPPAEPDPRVFFDE